MQKEETMIDLIPSSPPGGEFLFYQTEDGGIWLQVRVQQETVWLSLNQMAELFQRDKSVISRHIGKVFEEGKLRREATVAKSATVQTEGGKQVTREIEFFNLDVIISVGYRVKSQRGTQFRIWATQRLREYIVKGFAMDDERLKQRGGGNYFPEEKAVMKMEIGQVLQCDNEPCGLTMVNLNMLVAVEVLQEVANFILAIIRTSCSIDSGLSPATSRTVNARKLMHRRELQA